jgi:hypothetical protein
MPLMRGRTSAGATKDSGPLAICVAKINLSLQNIQDWQTGSRPDRLAKCTGLTGGQYKRQRFISSRRHEFPSFSAKFLSVPEPQRRRPRHPGLNFKRAKNFGNAPLHEDEGKSANRLT